jgi:hypothetical protein
MPGRYSGVAHDVSQDEFGEKHLNRSEVKPDFNTYSSMANLKV